MRKCKLFRRFGRNSRMVRLPKLLPRFLRVFPLWVGIFALASCQGVFERKSKVSDGYLGTPQPLQLASPLQNDEIGAEAAIFTGWCSLGLPLQVSYGGTFSTGNPSVVNCEPCTVSESAACGKETYSRGKYRFQVNFSGAVGSRTVGLTVRGKQGTEAITRTVNYRPLALRAYLKPSHKRSTHNYMGNAVAVDGNTAVFTDFGGGEETDIHHGSGSHATPKPGSGRRGYAYVFTHDGTNWAQEAILTPPYMMDQTIFEFGSSAAISGDTIVIGAAEDALATPGVSNAPDLPAVSQKSINQGSIKRGNFFNSGAAFVFKRSGVTWAVEAVLKAPELGTGDEFGWRVAIDGDRIVVGAAGEDSNQTTITNGTTASSDDSATDSGAAYVFERTSSTWRQTAYLKAPNAEAGDRFGTSVGIYGDTVAVGANQEDSNQTTITNGTSASSNNSSASAGAVYIYRLSGGNWQSEAYVKPPNAEADDQFGYSLGIYGDALVVGAYNEDSNQTTITNGATASADNSASNAGAAYIFRRTGVNWAQEAYLKAGNAEASDVFGYAVDIDADTVAVGAYGEDSNLRTITNGTGTSANNGRTSSGAVYVYKRTVGTWDQEAYLKTPNADSFDAIAQKIAISGDWLVTNALGDDSNATGVTNGSASADNSFTYVGSGHAYQRSGVTWSYSAYFKQSKFTSLSYFGFNLSADGDTVVVSSYMDDGADTTITNGATWTPASLANRPGSVYVFRVSGGTWAQEAVLKAPNAGTDDYFGVATAISGDTIAVGAHFEDSNQTTITNGTTASADNSAEDSGAVYVFTRSGVSWSQQAYIKASNADAGDEFGGNISLYQDTLIVGASKEDSNQTTITNGAAASADNSAAEAGAAYVFSRSGTNWTQTAYLKAPNAEAGDLFGNTTGISDGLVAVGASQEDSSAKGIYNGAVADNNLSTNSGALYTFSLSGGNWGFSAYIKSDNAEEKEVFPYRLSMDQSRLLVAHPWETTSAGYNKGAAYLYRYSGGSWAVERKFTSDLTGNTTYGEGVSLKGDYLLLTSNENTLAAGITDATVQNLGTETNRVGGAFLYKLNPSGVWQLRNYVKPILPYESSVFRSPTIGTDFIAIGAPYEANDTTGVANGPTVTDYGATGLGLGAVYVYGLDP